ncbi:hypothetical protein ABPG74_018881 [Tetrahymena malaccensis]
MNKKNFLFGPSTLSEIYDELQQNDIYLTGIVSQGQSGVIFNGEYENEQVNIKCSKITDTERIEEQTKILQALKNTSYVCQPIKQFYSSDKSMYYQVSKKYSCNLQAIMQNLIQQNEALELNPIIGFAIQMSTAFETMQQNQIFHSDVNPENILYDSLTESIELTNFGKSKYLKSQEGSKIVDDNDNEKKYFSPEYYENQSNLDIKHDIYGLGLIILELSVGKCFNNLECKQIMNGQIEGYMSKKEFYQELNQIIIQMLQIKPNDRIDSIQVKKLFEDLKLKLINEFILSVENKVDSFTSKRMISQFKQSYVQLDLDYNEQEEIRLDEYSFQGIDKLPKINEYLKKRIVHHLNLDFSYNGIDKESSQDISDLLTKCQNITCLNINLRGNKICAEAIQNIVISLEQCCKITSINIDLRENQIGINGAIHIGQLLEKFDTLKTLSLDLRENNVGVDGVKSIAMSMQKCYQITSLNLFFNSSDMNEDGTTAIEEMRKNMRKLDEFNFYCY